MRYRHHIIGEAEYAAARNTARIVKELAADPATRVIHAFLREECKHGIFTLNELVSAREMVFRLSGGLTAGTAEWSNIPELSGHERIPISTIAHPEDDRIELDELRRAFIGTMLRSYQSKYQREASFIVRNLGMLEAR